MRPVVLKYANAGHVARAAASDVVLQAKEAIAARGRFYIALAGGSTPRRLYEILAAPGFRQKVEWNRVDVFWGDERCVAPDDVESNFRMVREALLEHVPIPDENIHRMQGELEASRAALLYQQELRSTFGGGEGVLPRFDLILLGMGTDGHTASLFPDTPVVHERNAWVAGHYVEKLGAWRLTLTPVVINAARKVSFLVTGEQKAGMLRAVLMGRYQPNRRPAQVVEPADGELSWYVDQAAAQKL